MNEYFVKYSYVEEGGAYGKSAQQCVEAESGKDAINKVYENIGFRTSKFSVHDIKNLSVKEAT